MERNEMMEDTVSILRDVWSTLPVAQEAGRRDESFHI